MLAVWFFTLYALLNLHLHYGVQMLAELGKKSQKIKMWQVLLPAIAVFLVGYGMHRNVQWMQMFLSYYSYVAVPFMVVMPIFVLCMAKKGEHK